MLPHLLSSYSRNPTSITTATIRYSNNGLFSTSMKRTTNIFFQQQQQQLVNRLLSTSSNNTRIVRDILDEKRGYRAGDDLKAYLKTQFALNTINKSASAKEMLDKMLTSQTSVLVVIDDDKKIAGVVSDRDYIKLSQKRNMENKEKRKPDEDIGVGSLMTPSSKLVTVDYNDTVERCQELMQKNKIRFLPVLFSGKLHGILTFSDFLSRPSRFEPETRRALFAEEGVNIVTDDYSFALTDMESDKVKEDLAKRVDAIKNRKL
jgi:CBS domain-containing protein